MLSTGCRVGDLMKAQWSEIDADTRTRTFLSEVRRPPRAVGPAFVANPLRQLGGLDQIGVKTAYIEPGSPWESGYCESFNGTLRDNLLKGEIFYGVREAQILVNAWVPHYNTVRPHSALGYRPAAPETQITSFVANDHPAMH